MNMIVAADKKNGIGYQGKLLVTIPFDQPDVCLKDAQTLY